MFFNNINQTIDLISHSEFKEGKINLELDRNARFFLSIGTDFDGTFKGESVTLILNKNITNSLGNAVNPEYIEKLKKTITVFLNAVAMNWTVENQNDENITICNLNKELEKSSNWYCILTQIAKQYNLFENIKIKRYSNQTIAKATRVVLLKFTRILRWEAIQANNSPAIKTIPFLIFAKNGHECFSSNHIPKELTEYIIELISTSLEPNAIHF